METERAQIGEKRVTADQWDVDGWQMLASEAQKSPLELAKPVYERLVTQFPPFGKFWKLYAEHLSKETPENHDDIQKVYERAVKVAPTSIDLWLSYVSFASSLARDEPGSKMEAEAIKVYERALTAAGLDLAAIPLWSHYLDFVKNHTTQSDIHRRDALRRVYQRAVMIFILIPSLYLRTHPPAPFAYLGIRAQMARSKLSFKKEHILLLRRLFSLPPLDSNTHSLRRGFY